jgi:hypothetical protein
MSTATKQVESAIKAIRNLPFPGVSISVQGADSIVCIAIDYTEAGIDDPDQLEPIYQAIDAALCAHGCTRGSGCLVDGIEGIEIELPAIVEKVECDGLTAVYEAGFVEVGNRGAGVAMLAWAVIIGSADADNVGVQAQITWQEDGNGDAIDWDTPEAIKIVG